MRGFSFRELTVYQEGRKFVNQLYELSTKFPKDEMFGITDQIRRAALSINLNIAEGNGRPTRREQRRFYDVAHGSLFECIAILDICRDRSYLSEQEFQSCETMANEVLALLNGLIKYVKT